jgi:osmotically-inducible protein OsmY
MKHLMNLTSAFFMVLAFFITIACTSTPSQEGMGEYVDDSILTAKINAAILGEPTLSSVEINVETFKGEVQLSGFVDSSADISKAVAVAKDVIGVKSVKNDMRLK